MLAYDPPLSRSHYAKIARPSKEGMTARVGIAPNDSLLVRRYVSFYERGTHLFRHNCTQTAIPSLESLSRHKREAKDCPDKGMIDGVGFGDAVQHSEQSVQECDATAA